MSSRRVKRQGEENSSMIHQLLSEIKRLQHIGSANKNWINCIVEGDITDPSRMSCAQSYRNNGSDNMRPIFAIPLPYILGGSHNLVVTRVKVGIEDADANDYLDKVTIRGWTDNATDGEITSDDTNRTAAGEYTYDIDDITVGGTYERINIELQCVNDAQYDLDISYLQVEYYYTE